MFSIHKSEKVPVEKLTVKSISVACQVKAKNVRSLINVIRSLNFTNNTEMHFSKTGMKFIAEQSQFFQGSAYIKNGFFYEYRFKRGDDDVLNFGIDLSKLTEFLNAFIDNDMCLLKIVYYGDDKPVAFVFNQTDLLNHKKNAKNAADDSLTTFIDLPNDDKEESAGLVVTEYIINTKNSINPVDFNSIQLKSKSLLVIETKPFLECIQDFDSKTITDILITINKQQLMMRSVGIQQCDTMITVKLDHKFVQRKDVFEDSKFSYRFSCFKNMMKALHMATRLSMETFESGLIQLQLMVKAEEPNTEAIYLEFDIGANIDDDDDFDDEEEWRKESDRFKEKCTN